MRVRFLKEWKGDHMKKSYPKGKLAVIDWAIAPDLIKDGIVEPVNPVEEQVEVKKKLIKSGIKINK